MVTKKKKARLRPGARAGERPGETLARLLIGLERKVDSLERVVEMHRQETHDALRQRDARPSSSRPVTVVMIGECLRDRLAAEDARVRPGRDALSLMFHPEPPQLVRCYLVQTVLVPVPQPGSSSSAQEGARIWIDDPARRLWAPGAWLIALNGGLLSSVRVGDMACGAGTGAAPVAILEHAIQRAVQVGALVTLEPAP